MKSQVVVLNEVITFTIGVSLVIGLAIFISNLFVPSVRDYVFDQEMDNFLNYADNSFFKLYSLTKETDSINITYRTNFPDKLVESIYYLTVEGRNLCVVLESFGSKKCMQVSLPVSIGFTGYFISGTKIKIDLLKTDSTAIQFSNSY
jgi:hypothetical protein